MPLPSPIQPLTPEEDSIDDLEDEDNIDDTLPADLWFFAAQSDPQPRSGRD